MNNTDHLTLFLEAMGRRDVAAASEHLAEDITILSPIFTAPFHGKEAAANVLAHLLETLDRFEPKMLLRDGTDCVAIFSARFGDHAIDGADHIHQNESGLIERMTVSWRPLAAVAAVQQVLAPKLGERALRLVPLD